MSAERSAPGTFYLFLEVNTFFRTSMQVKCLSELLNHHVSTTGFSYEWILNILETHDPTFNQILNGHVVTLVRIVLFFLLLLKLFTIFRFRLMISVPIQVIVQKFTKQAFLSMNKKNLVIMFL
jgi:hypothetical protein